jgi:hypothetical protein
VRNATREHGFIRPGDSRIRQRSHRRGPHPAAQAARFARSRHSLTPKSRLADAGAYGDGFNAGTPMPSSICGNCHSGICVNGVHRTNCDPGFGVASEKRRFTKQRRFLPLHFGGKHNGDFTGRLGVRSVSSRADCRRRCDSCRQDKPQIGRPRGNTTRPPCKGDLGIRGLRWAVRLTLTIWWTCIALGTLFLSCSTHAQELNGVAHKFLQRHGVPACLS